MDNQPWPSEERDRLQAALQDLGLVSGAIAIEPLGEGRSNLTFRVSAGARRLVIRRPPPKPRPIGSHDMVREAALLKFLAAGSIPVATVQALVPPGQVCDEALMVLDYLDGCVITARTPAPLNTPAIRRALFKGYVETLAKIHALDCSAVSGRQFATAPRANLQAIRNVEASLLRYCGKLPDRMLALANRLCETAPPASRLTLVHNDYRFGNLVWSRDRPGALLGVLDWEFASIGDPLMDLAYAIIAYPSAEGSNNPIQDMAAGLLEAGFPRDHEILDQYVAIAGIDRPQLTWHMGANLWRLSALYEYSRLRNRDPYFQAPGLVERLLDAAEAALAAG